MKKLLIIFFCLFLSSCSDNINSDVRKEAAQRVSENQYKVNTNLLNNYIEGNFGCAMAEFFVYAQQLGNSNSISYVCQGDNLPAGSLGSKVMTRIYIAISLIISIIFAIVYSANMINALKAATSHDKRKRQTAGIVIESVLLGAAIFLFEFIVIAAIGIFFPIADQHTINETDSQLTVDDNQEIADKRTKNDVFKNIIDYMVCVNSKEFSKSKQNPDISFFRTDEGVSIKGRFERCDLDGGFLYDNFGLSVTDSYGIAKDYKEQQSRAIIEALREYINSASPYAIRISNGDQSILLKSVFDNSTSCSDILYSKNVEEYDYDDLAKYRTKVNACLSEKVMTRLLRVPSYDNNSPQWKSVNICSGTENQVSAAVDRKSLIAKIDACVSSSCSDIVNSSSSYACGVALTKYHTIKDDRWKQLLTIYAINPDRQADYKSAKRPLNSLNTQFSFLEKKTYPINDGDLIDKIKVSVNSGSLNRESIEKIFKSSYDNAYIESSEEDYATKFYSFFVNKNGLFGLNRFFTCSANLFAYKDGYYCKSFTYERRLAGATMLATGAMLDGISSLAKKSKPTAKSKTDEIQLRNHQKDLEGIGINKAGLAMLIPLFAKGLGVAGGDDIFGEQFYNITGDTGFLMAIAVLVSTSPEIASLVNLLATGLKFMGLFFNYGFELMIFVLVCVFLVRVLASVMIRIQTHKIAAILEIGSNTTRNDLDRKPMSLFLEELAIMIISFAPAYFTAKMLLDVMLVCIVGDMREFASVSLGTSMNESVSNTIFAMFLSLVVFVIILKNSVGYIRLFYELILGMVHGKLNEIDLRVQGMEERKSFNKVMKSKQL